MQSNQKEAIRSAIRIQKYEEKYHDQSIDILGQIWKSQDYAERDKLFRWRYLENPYLDVNFVFIAVYNERVIGIAPYVVERFDFNGKPKIVLAAADTVIDSKFQGLGVYTMMVDAAMQDVAQIANEISFAAYLNLSSNENSTPACLKIGWRPLEKRSNLYRISLYNTLLSFCKPGSFPTNFNYKNKNLHYCISDTIELNSMLRMSMKRVAPIQNLRDEPYYSWRYKYYNSDIRFCYLFEKSDLLAYLIVQRINKHQSTVLEYGFNSEQAILKLVRFVQKRLRIPILRLYYMVLPELYESALKRAGFIKEPGFFETKAKKHRYPVLIRMNEPQKGMFDDPVLDGIDMCNCNNWFFTKSDVY